ncbi:MAG: DsrE family protein [Deltaproteobacteria bacterium]|nr:DsrE family protein [Deltaproteobacteria bacterium]
MTRVALVAFNGDQMCFVHVLLNSLDMKRKGFDVRIVIEGSTTKLLPDLVKAGNPLNGLYNQVREQGLIFAVCKACALKMNVLESIMAEGLPIADELSGHVSLADYIKEGYQIITF